jgi:hypothetical protein
MPLVKGKQLEADTVTEREVAKATAVEITDSTNAQGAGPEIALADHQHAHGNRGGGALHAAATGATAGFMSAADKAKLDSITGASGVKFKPPVRVISDSNQALSGVPSIDGVALSAGDRVLLTNQTTPSQNGIWEVQVGAWNRPADFAVGDGAASSVVWASEGSTYADTEWVCTTDEPSDIIDTDPLAWSQAPTSNSIIAGDGLVRTGQVIDVVANGDGSIVANANDIQVGVLASDAQHGSRGGGALHADATGAVAGFMSAADKTKLDGIASGAQPNQTITAGAGLVGGGSGAAITVDAAANADGSIVVNADDIQVGVLATDAQHGNRGGGALHADATGATAGFMSAADKTKLDGIETGATATTAQQESVTTEIITGTDQALADTLNNTPKSPESVSLFLNGVHQRQGAGFDYTIAGSTITWLASSGTAVDMETTDTLIAVYES